MWIETVSIETALMEAWSKPRLLRSFLVRVGRDGSSSRGAILTTYATGHSKFAASQYLQTRNSYEAAVRFFCLDWDASIDHSHRLA